MFVLVRTRRPNTGFKQPECGNSRTIIITKQIRPLVNRIERGTITAHGISEALIQQLKKMTGFDCKTLRAYKLSLRLKRLGSARKPTKVTASGIISVVAMITPLRVIKTMQFSIVDDQANSLSMRQA